MKKSIIRISVYVLIAAVISAVLLTSCTSVRQAGCPNTYGFGGYK